MTHGIVETDGVLGGKPRLKNHRISVADIIEMSKHGRSESQIAEELQIEPLDVNAALRHYRMHKEQIDQQLDEREQLHRELSEQGECAPS